MSIRSRLLWLTLLVTLLPVCLQLTRFVQERERAIEADAAALALIAQRRAELINERIQAAGQLLFGLARASDLDTTDTSGCSAFLAQVINEFPQFTGLLSIRPDGQLDCDSLMTGRRLDLTDRNYFQAALSAPSGVTLEAVFGRLTGKPVLQVAHPVRGADAQLRFVLLASLDLGQLFGSQNFSVPGARLLLVDNQGTVLATTRRDAGREVLGSSLAGTPVHAFSLEPRVGTREMSGPDGEVAVWAASNPDTLARAGLHVLASVPKHNLLEAANRNLRVDLTALAAMALLIFSAVWLFTETAVRRQIARISVAARKLATGDLSARVAAPLPSGELGELMTVFNQSAQSLQQQQADIEKLNEKLRRSQRLEAVGQLTGGLAHDFNNLLTVVMGNAELLSELNADKPEQRQLAQMIGQAAQRGAELTQRLLAFARKQALAPKPVDVNHMLAGMDSLLRRSLGTHIQVELIRAAGLWPAIVDAGQLENALLNLALNARDAMPEGGKLTLETANVRLDADYASRHVEVTPGQYVMLAVSDTGKGIAAADLPRVFEPFFTTKEAGRGTGLGLAMVWGFVKQSGGHINIYSEIGQGTTAKLYLPRASETATLALDALPGDQAAGGNETILLVEDDAAVRSYAATQLRALGYTVIEAEHAKAALDILDSGQAVDLLFTDVVMPGGINGRALADLALARRPGLKLLYTSGYTENAIVHQGRLDPGALLLAKPYGRKDLDRMVRVALGTPTAPA